MQSEYVTKMVKKKKNRGKSAMRSVGRHRKVRATAGFGAPLCNILIKIARAFNVKRA